MPNPAQGKTKVNKKGFLTVAKAANILGVSPSTLRRLEQNGRIQSVRKSNGYRTFNFQTVNNLKNELKSEKELEVQKRLAKKQERAKVRIEKYQAAQATEKQSTERAVRAEIEARTEEKAPLPARLEAKAKTSLIQINLGGGAGRSPPTKRQTDKNIRPT